MLSHISCFSWPHTTLPNASLVESLGAESDNFHCLLFFGEIIVKETDFDTDTAKSISLPVSCFFLVLSFLTKTETLANFYGRFG